VPAPSQPRFKSCAEHPESKGSTRCDECGAKLRALNERMTAAVFGADTARGAAPAVATGEVVRKLLECPHCDGDVSGRAHDPRCPTLRVDLRVRDEGTVVQFIPETDAGRAFLEELASEGWQWLGKSLVVEHRSAGDVVRGAQENGLRVAS